MASQTETFVLDTEMTHRKITNRFERVWEIATKCARRSITFWVHRRHGLVHITRPGPSAKMFIQSVDLMFLVTSQTYTDRHALVWHLLNYLGWRLRRRRIFLTPKQRFAKIPDKFERVWEFNIQCVGRSSRLLLYAALSENVACCR